MHNQKEGDTNQEVRGSINLLGLQVVHMLAVDVLRNRGEKDLREIQTVNLTMQHFIITYTKRLSYTHAIQRWFILSLETVNLDF